jgi:hypothetical protein
MERDAVAAGAPELGEDVWGRSGFVSAALHNLRWTRGTTLFYGKQGTERQKKKGVGGWGAGAIHLHTSSPKRGPSVQRLHGFFLLVSGSCHYFSPVDVVRDGIQGLKKARTGTRSCSGRRCLADNAADAFTRHVDLVGGQWGCCEGLLAPCSEIPRSTVRNFLGHAFFCRQGLVERPRLEMVFVPSSTSAIGGTSRQK